jgi:hypothetical protein
LQALLTTLVPLVFCTITNISEQTGMKL